MRPPGGRAGALAAASVAAVVLATFADAFTGARVFYQRDIHAYWYPHMAVVRRAIAEGSWPLWNPWVGFGAPLLADATFQLAYPPTWLTMAFAPAVQLKIMTVGHCLLASFGAGALARRRGLGWTAAGVAGTAYALSGPFLSAASLFHHYAGAAWLPWLLFALEGLIRQPGAGSALWLGLVAGAQLLAGSGDMCLAGAILGIARLGWFLVRERAGHGRLLSLAGSGALAATLALALSALQWLPTAERAREGFRTGQDSRTSTYWSLHPASLFDLTVPRLVTDLPLSAEARGEMFEGREPLLACLYLGLVPVALAVLGLALRGRLAAPAGAGFLFFLIAALGRHTPVYGLLLGVPGFGLMRFPQKFLLPAALCLAVMAAAGVAAWGAAWSIPKRRRGRIVAALLLLAAASFLAAAGWVTGAADAVTRHLDVSGGGGDVALAIRTSALKLARSALLAGALGLLLWRRAGRERAGRAATVALLGLGALDLVAVGRGVNPLAPRGLLDHRPPVVDRLAGEGVRLHATIEGRDCLTAGATPLGWEPTWIAALGFQDTLRPPTGARWGLRGSYDGEFTGLGSRWSAPFSRDALGRLGTPGGLRLLQLAGVTHVLRVGTSMVPGLDLLETRASPYVCPLQVWRVPDTLPGAYVVRGERSAADPEATLRILLDPGFAPRSEVVLAAARGRGQAASPGADDVRVVSRRLDAIEVEAQLAAAGILVVLEAFEPGWVATVDAAPAEVLRANGLFRAVRLEAGRHRVRFAYRPRSVAYGAAISAFGLAAALGLGLLSLARAMRLKGAAARGSIAAGRAW
jgi:hypothetical protein